MPDATGLELIAQGVREKLGDESVVGTHYVDGYATLEVAPSSIREVLTHERNALLFEPGNPQALTAAVRRIKENAALAERLARQAVEDVREYTWARRAERLEALFNEVLATRPARGTQQE